MGKPKTLKQKRTKYIRERQTAAKEFIKKLEKKGYVVTDKNIMKAIELRDVSSKRQYESIKKYLTQDYIEGKALYGIKAYKKQVTQQRYDQPYPRQFEEPEEKRQLAQYNEVTGDWTFFSRVGSVTKQDWDRVLAGSDYALAEITNKLINEQRKTGWTPDSQLKDVVWDLAHSYGAQYVLKDKDGKFTSFTETGDQDVDMETFYQLVHFTRIDTSLKNDIETEIMAHPQTNPELHAVYLMKAQQRGSETNEYNLIHKQAEKLNMPEKVVRQMIDLMHTSEVWNIAKKGAYDSDQVLMNWEHIYQDLKNLEGTKQSSLTSHNTDALRRALTNGDSSVTISVVDKDGEKRDVTYELNVQTIGQITEEILRQNSEEYKNQMGSYYNPTESKKWFNRHKSWQYQRSGNHNKGKGWKRR